MNSLGVQKTNQGPSLAPVPLLGLEHHEPLKLRTLTMRNAKASLALKRLRDPGAILRRFGERPPVNVNLRNFLF
jgi:hypothetical protein